MRVEHLGGLKVRLVGGTDGRGGGQGPMVVLLHGFGAPGDDLVPLWEAIPAPPGTRFAFPEGRLSLPFGFSRAWWMIDMERLERDRAAGRTRGLSQDRPAGLAEARAQVLGLLDDLENKWGVDTRRTVLGGFSQGAMLSCDVALRSDRALAGLVLLSATLLAKDEWTPLMSKRRGLRVLQSHGTADPLLPFSLAEQLRDSLVRAGLSVEWVKFSGGHEIPGQVLTKMGGFLAQVLA